MRLFLLLLALAAIAQGQCSSNSVAVNGFCSCFSGFFDETCSSQQACAIEPAQLLQTSPVAEFMVGQSSISANTFTFVINSPQKTGRHFTQLSLGSCGLDGSHFSRIDSGSCVDTFVGAFSIPEVSNCGFQNSSDPSFLYLTGPIRVTAKDPLGDFRGYPVERLTVSTKTVTLRFPTSITLSSSNVTVVSQISLMAAITSQDFDGLDTVTIELLTSVQYPYKLSEPTFVLQNELLVVSSPALVDTDCLEESGDCVQTTTFTISGFGGEACKINGNYSLEFPETCRVGVNCPLDGTEVSKVDLSLESDDLCAVIEFQSSLSGTLEGYSDDTFTTPAIAFLSGQPINLLATLESDVEIGGVVVTFVGITPSGGSLQSVSHTDGAHPTAVGSTIQITLSLGTELPPGELAIFTVQVDLEVSYLTTFKRDVVSKDVSVSKQLVLRRAP